MNRIVIDKTLVGPLSVAEENDAIVSVAFGDLGALGGENALLAEARRQIDAYFSGTLRRFDLPLRLCGTPFRRLVWQTLAQVPYGQTVTYGQLAAACGRPNAARAVGSALHDNPIVLILPCHRVIGANGDLTGFAGGIKTKAFLLELERRYAAGEECR